VHLALGDELGERADRLLDRDVRVDAVLVVEVDVVGAEPGERAFDRPPHVLRGTVEPPRAVRHGPYAELRRDRHLVAAAGNRTADQLLVRVRPVDLGGVEEGDPQLDRALNGRDRLRLVGLAVEGGHAHAAEAESGDGKAFGAELTLFHGTPFACRISPSTLGVRARAKSRVAAITIA
jgi:hypothetical protein